MANSVIQPRHGTWDARIPGDAREIWLNLAQLGAGVLVMAPDRAWRTSTRFIDDGGRLATAK